MGEPAVEDEFLRLRVADAAGELRARSLLNRKVHIHHVSRAWYRGRLKGHGLHVREALDALLGAVERDVREPAALKLTHLAPQDLVVDAVLPRETDIAHGDAIHR